MGKVRPKDEQKPVAEPIALDADLWHQPTTLQQHGEGFVVMVHAAFGDITYLEGVSPPIQEV